MEAVRLAVVGMGLIGGSLALALRGRPPVAEVVGIDRDPRALELALSLGAADRVTTELDGVSGCRVVIISVPVCSIVTTAREIIPYCDPGTVISDVGSTKGAICREIGRFIPPEMTFIGGHPMSGSERTGIAAADRYLFQNAVYVLTPPDPCPDGALRLMEELVRAAGAHPLMLTPDEHDRAVAVTSHLPHVTAAALVQALARVGASVPAAYQLVAGGFRDTTRIAAGNPALWRDICLSNRDALLDVIDEMQAALSRFRDVLARGDGPALEQAFDEARRRRSGLRLHSKGILGRTFDIVVHVVDRPGVIGHVGTLLAERGINIIDIEILRVREGEGGTLRLAFERPEAMEEAVAVLRDAGYPARPRDPA